jgi:hypothetical protein
MYRSDPPRRLGVRCALLLNLRRERGRREIAEPRMRPHRVEMLPPRFDQHLRLGSPDTEQRASPPLRQALAHRERYSGEASRHAHRFLKGTSNNDHFVVGDPAAVA